MTATDELGDDFWTWRAAQMPRSHDDIPRITRPAGWLPRWSAADVLRYRTELADFVARLDELPATDDRAESVDRILISSACSRVQWELDILRMWQTQPRLYTDQTAGAVFEVLLPPDPDEARIGQVVALLEHTPGMLADGRANLADTGVAEFGQLAVDELDGIEHQLDTAMAALASRAGAELADRLRAAAK